MTCRDIQAQLSAYLDHTLAREARAEIAAHLPTCADCRAVVDDLDRVRQAARTLGPITPPAHLWIELAGRIRLEGGARATGATVTASAQRSTRAPRSEAWQWLGLAAALILITTAVYVVARPDAAPDAPVSAAAGNASEPATVETVEDTLRRAEAEYERAIVMLQEIVERGDPSVNAGTLAALQKVDSAIAESRAALTDNPASEPARTSLFEALASKVNLLQSTVVLMNEMRKGDAGGAAEAAAGTDRKIS